MEFKLVILASMLGWVVDVNGAFLKGDIEDGEVIHMEVPEGWERHYDNDVVLKLK